jgi:hypothetical protein
MKQIVKIAFPNIKGKAIVQKGNEIFIIKASGYYKDQEIIIDSDDAIKFPSLLYALSTLYEDNFEEAVKFIKENF